MAMVTSDDSIETERLVLRPPGEADVPRIARLANNRAIAEMLARLPHPYDEDHARAWVSRVARMGSGTAAFAIGCKAEGGGFIGACGYDTVLTGEPNLGYWLGQPYWGQGYASEAAAAVVRHAFDIAGLDYLGSGCRPDNPASRRVLEKIGFRSSGRKAMFFVNVGREVEVETFRLTREQWLDGQARD